MEQMRFSMMDLLAIARIGRKRTVYGIPDVLADLSEKDVVLQLQSATDALIDRGVLLMDFDGRMLLQQEYTPLLTFCCDCEHCITMDIQKKGQAQSGLIFWKRDGKILSAESEDGSLLFSFTNADFVRACVPLLPIQPTSSVEGIRADIPQSQLVQAHRAGQSADKQTSVRILMQNGISDLMIPLILDGFAGKAEYFGMRSIIPGREIELEELAFLSGRGMVLRLYSAVVNLHTCTGFEGVPASETWNRVNACLNSFLAEEEKL